MSVPLYFVDAFAYAPYTGNPAAVVLLDRQAPDEWMRALGAELNQAATAFVAPRDDGTFDLRWMTATSELELCGHGTLAAAHILREKGAAITFHTLAGELHARLSDGSVTLDFPALPPRTVPRPAELDRVLPADEPVAVYRTDLDYLVELGSEAQLRDARPDLDALAELAVRGLILTAAATDGAKDHDFVSRFFAPARGIPEDSVTGSAHCALAPHWLPRFGAETITGYQASSRGGYVRVSQPSPDRVGLTGNAITLISGTLHDP
ncbi:MAG: PhzF family phenazine biosynthesis isomerase [Pseudonocardiaceae bacterium]|nr:PhzF family phenazine biosynthesis isomerase [Pseudonocardiaceae bacterium]